MRLLKIKSKKHREAGNIREMNWKYNSGKEKKSHFTLIDARELFTRQSGTAGAQGMILKIVYINKNK
jgi:hypothetical protein